MSIEATVIQGPPPIARRDTARSWRVINAILVWLFSGIAALLGFFNTYSSASRGDSDASVTEFETSLREYIRAATQAGCSKISGVEFERYYVEISTQSGVEQEATRLAHAVNNLSPQNQECAKAKLNQTVAEYNFARSSDQADLRVHSDASLRALKREWVRKNTYEAVFKGLGVAAVSGIVAWIVTWLLVVGLAVIWWFMMDRLRDVSHAIKGQ